MQSKEEETSNNDILSKILAAAPEDTNKKKAPGPAPGVCIAGDVEYMAVTMSGPITFPTIEHRKRRP